MPRTPNTNCCLCGKQLYRRPKDLGRARFVSCRDCWAEAKRKFGPTDAEKRGLALGRQKGTNHLEGIPKSDASNRKRSQSMYRAIERDPDLPKRRAEQISGENHYRWNGGVASLNQAVRRMTENRRWMQKVVERDGCCQRCGRETDLEAHHKTHLSDLIQRLGIKTCNEAARFADVLWDLDNGKTLCVECHAQQHGRDYSPVLQGRRHQPRKQRRSFAGDRNPNWRGGNVNKECEMCQSAFSVKPARADKARFCSRECHLEDRRRNLSKNAA